MLESTRDGQLRTWREPWEAGETGEVGELVPGANVYAPDVMSFAQRPDALSVRVSASPFTPFDGTHCSYLVSRSVFSALQKERDPAEDEDANAKGAAPSVSVAFQSALNGEQWWSPEDPSVGIVARPMAPG